MCSYKIIGSCHFHSDAAVLCKTEARREAMAVLLQPDLSTALKEGKKDRKEANRSREINCWSAAIDEQCNYKHWVLHSISTECQSSRTALLLFVWPRQTSALMTFDVKSKATLRRRMAEWWHCHCWRVSTTLLAVQVSQAAGNFSSSIFLFHHFCL